MKTEKNLHLKNIYLLLICSFFSIFFVTSCRFLTNHKNTEPWAAFPLEISKGVCFGVCPIYKATLFQNKTLIFKGIKNTKFIGTKEIKLSKKEYMSILSAYQKINFSELNKTYDQSLLDLPITIVKDNKNSVSFKVNKSVPKNVRFIVKLFDKILKAEKLL